MSLVLVVVCRFRALPRFSCFVFALALGCLGCAKPKVYDPYQVPREDFAKAVRTIGIVPPAVALSGDRRSSVAADIELTLADELQARGYQVVRSDVVAPVWRRLLSQAKRTMEAQADQVDEKTLEQLYVSAAQELARSHGVDAVAEIWTSEHPYFAADGAPPWPEFLGEPVHLDGQLVQDMPQLLVAAWATLEITRTDGRLLYKMRVPVHWTEVYVARSYYRRPERELFPTERVHVMVRALLHRLEAAPASTSQAEVAPGVAKVISRIASRTRRDT